MKSMRVPCVPQGRSGAQTGFATNPNDIQVIVGGMA